MSLCRITPWNFTYTEREGLHWIGPCDLRLLWVPQKDWHICMKIAIQKSFTEISKLPIYFWTSNSRQRWLILDLRNSLLTLTLMSQHE
nr:hypothetical protein Iba_scaffold15442CG0010 [Ipomoea batatas]